MKRENFQKQLYRAGSVLLLLFSLWCYMIYAEVNWKKTISFAQDCYKIIVTSYDEKNVQ
jgi:hypothetical protein